MDNSTLKIFILQHLRYTSDLQEHDTVDTILTRHHIARYTELTLEGITKVVIKWGSMSD